jgi:hypothetical protein
MLKTLTIEKAETYRSSMSDCASYCINSCLGIEASVASRLTSQGITQPHNYWRLCGSSCCATHGFLDPLLFSFTWKFILIIGCFQGELIGCSFSIVFIREHVVLEAFIIRIGSCLDLDYTFYEFIRFIKVTLSPFTLLLLSPLVPTNI